MARLRLRGPLKALAGDRGEHRLAGASVAELLGELERSQPALRGWIVDERGAIRPHINVFVNGERGGADTQLAADDLIDIIPAITGG